MSKANSRPDGWRIILIFLPAALVFAADQLTKVWIKTHLAIGETLFQAGIFSITRVSPNTGAAFGLFRSGTLILIIIDIIFAILVLLYAFNLYRRFPLLDSRWNNLAIGLILGGTLGNLVERFGVGVTDFISFGWWPTFNVADSSVTVGAVILAISLMISLKDNEQAPA
jgi:signal peptidase II